MLLQIIDNQTSDPESSSIQIILENKDKSETKNFITESYSSPFSVNFRKTLAHYFSHFLLKDSNTAEFSGVVEKLINFGHNLGDELLGEDHQLLKFTENIEQEGYEKLDVRIESKRIAFFSEIWETLILPESKYLLSTVAKSFSRQFTQENSSWEYPELNYYLQIAPPQDKIEELLNEEGTSKPVKKQEGDKPLNILYLVSRPTVINTSSNAMNTCLETVATSTAINSEIHPLTNWQQLQDRLSDQSRPVHILHYDGPIIFENSVPNISFEMENQAALLIPISELSDTLVKRNVALLSIDALSYSDDKPILASEGLAKIAQVAHKQGLGNVIGLGEFTTSWTSKQCFDSLYLQLARGHRLSQATVEARKVLQSNIETSLTSVNPVAFHLWPLLVHYSQQSVVFYNSNQIPDDINSQQQSAIFSDKLFGFRSNMLPPLLNQVGDGQSLALITQLAMSQQSSFTNSVAVTGAAGTGKTQLAHVVSLYLAQMQLIDYAFYFDFRNNDYTKDDMLEMIAPIFELAVDQLDKVEKHLTQVNCCFVFDDIFNLPKKEQFNETYQSLSEFVSDLTSSGHHVILLGESYSVLKELAAIEIKTKPLPIIEQKIIAADRLHNLNLTDTQLTQIDWYEKFNNLLLSIDGHPWLTKKITPLALSHNMDELSNLFKKNINSKKQGSKIELFYEWQWATLEPEWQQLLILCSDVPGLLIEMLMTAADRKEPFEPAKSLFTMLNKADGKVSQGLELWEAGGFISRFPHGRVIDPDCLSFLSSKRDTCFKNIDQEKLQLHFSQLICEGIRILAQHVASQPNPNISNNLLFNRRHWVKHFELLWFNHDYRGFMRVKAVFDNLLQQSNLAEESKVWSLDLLERTPTSENTNIEEKLSWLILALGVINQTKAKDSKCIIEGAKIWQKWFDSVNISTEKQQVSLFHHAAQFLESYYKNHENLDVCIKICDKSLAIYSQYQAWPKVVSSLKSLAKYHYELGDKERTFILENQILNDIPYKDSPPGYQVQQMLDILFSRLSRNETQHAQTLLDHINSTEESAKLTDMLNSVQSDIYFQEENYSAALTYCCKAWVKALQSNQAQQIELLKLRMIDIKKKIGAISFNIEFEREVPQGILNPCN